MGWYIVYLITLAVHCIVMTTSGYGITSWQCWVTLFCVIGANIAGSELENHTRRKGD
jgi:hypothetical protein